MRSHQSRLGIVYADNITSVRIGLNYEHYDIKNNSFLFGFEMSNGLPLDGYSLSSDNRTSRPGASGLYTKFNINISMIQHFFPTVSILFGLNTQYSFSELLSAEEFGFGGNKFGRGYDASFIVGDHGMAAKVEIIKLFKGVRKIIKNSQIYAFLDAGYIWNINETQDKHDSAYSAGLGYKVNFYKNISSNALFAWPVQSNVDYSHRFIINLSLAI